MVKIFETLGEACKRTSSFVRGTRVLLAGNRTQRIEKVVRGDYVLATEPATGETTAKRVTATITSRGIKRIMTIGVDDDGDPATRSATISATDNHPFWVPPLKTWVPAAALVVGLPLRAANGDEVQVTSITERTVKRRVHNLTVADHHTYYVAAGHTAVLVHNTSCDVPGIDSTGKLHGPLPPGNLVPDNWTADQLEQLEKDLVASIQRRKEVNEELGLDYNHAKRLADEEALLRHVRKRLSGS